MASILWTAATFVVSTVNQEALIMLLDAVASHLPLHDHPAFKASLVVSTPYCTHPLVVDCCPLPIKLLLIVS